jgi:hypothetical protein
MSPAKPPLTTTGSCATDDALWMARAMDLARHGEAFGRCRARRDALRES